MWWFVDGGVCDRRVKCLGLHVKGCRSSFLAQVALALAMRSFWSMSVGVAFLLNGNQCSHNDSWRLVGISFVPSLVNILHRMQFACFSLVSPRSAHFGDERKEGFQSSYVAGCYGTSWRPSIMAHLHGFKCLNQIGTSRY